MKIFITLDYELFLLDPGRDIENSLISPTYRLIKALKKNNIKAIFFVDAGYLVALNRQKENFISLAEDLALLIKQLKYLEKEGHEIGLHIHPHWEDCFFDGTKWNIDLRRFKLSDFNEKDTEKIFDNYIQFLRSVVNTPIQSYRAGGWCLEPFSHIKNKMKQHNIFIESSVVLGGFYKSLTHYYDFRHYPLKDIWRFSDNPINEDTDGYFIEIPLASHQLPPYLYWKVLYRNIILRSAANKKGKAIRPSIKEVFKKLLSKTTDAISIDSYKSDLLIKAVIEREQTNNKYLCIIGHPKCFTEKTFKNLENFVEYALNHNHSFETFSSGIEEIAFQAIDHQTVNSKI